MKQRANTVRPKQGNTDVTLAPLSEEHGDLETEQVADVDNGEEDGHDTLEEKVEELHTRFTQQFEDHNDVKDWKTRIVKSPHQPTEEEWERHCVIHTPYAQWCPHCVAGRAVRRQHPKQPRKTHMVPDTDKDVGNPHQNPNGIHVPT